MDESIYKKIVEASPDVFFYYSILPEKSLDYVSPSIKSLTGYPTEDYYENKHKILEIAAEENKQDLIRFFELLGESPSSISIEVIRKDGSRVWVKLRCSATISPDGAIEAVKGSIIDISDMKSAENELLYMTGKRNMLFTYISHELRTPITSIIGYMAAINDGTFSTEEEITEAMEVISAKVTTLEKLVTDMDHLSKMETNQFTFDFEVFLASELTNLLLSANIGKPMDEFFDIEVHANQEILAMHQVVCDYERINQVFGNLLSNAKKYADYDKRIVVSFSVDENEENYEVAVRDFGTGIRSEEIPFIFDSFYRSEYNKRREGRGLGLPLCKTIIERHQGTITVESEFGEGSTFLFTIPIHKEN